MSTIKKTQNVVNFYSLTNTLKNLIRKGWLNWCVNAERVESVAEHIYGTQMLALAMYSEFQYDIDIAKVMYMLAIHELEENIIGDLTYIDITPEEKKIIGHKAVEEILANLLNKEQIKALIFEFDERHTKEAIFAYHCDKLECDLQCKLYDEAGCVNPFEHHNIKAQDTEVIRKIQNGETSWSSSWLNHDRPKYEGDPHFMNVLDYAINNPITLKKKK